MPPLADAEKVLLRALALADQTTAQLTQNAPPAGPVKERTMRVAARLIRLEGLKLVRRVHPVRPVVWGVTDAGRAAAG